MICSEKERETCQVEKRGCEGCYYRGLTNEEVKQCLKELTEVRPEKLSDKIQLSNLSDNIRTKTIQKATSQLRKEIQVFDYILEILNKQKK